MGGLRDRRLARGQADALPAWSPDGRWIAYFSDESGEYELHVRSSLGDDQPRKISLENDPTFYFAPRWSPDSQKLAYLDAHLNTWYVDIDDAQPVKVDQDRYWGSPTQRIPVWSPDSRWLAYNKRLPNYLSAIFLYSVPDGTSTQLTDGLSDARHPVFDADGKYLYFTASTNVGPALEADIRSFSQPVARSVYLVVLSDDEPSPFAPESDEIEAKKDDEDDDDEDKKDGDKDQDATSDVVIDFDGILDRHVKFPIDPGLYGGLAAVKGRIFYSSSPLRGLDGPIERTKRSIHVFDMEDRKDHVFLEDYGGAELTPDGKKMIFSKGGKYEIIDATGDKAKTGENVLDLGKMKMRLDPRAEWRQIFEECWRLERDYFYDTLYHGIDWQAMHDRYSPLVDHVAHRFDLTYVIGEMLGELATGHTYVGGGEMPNPDGAGVGLLGNDWQIDSAAGRFQIGRILAGQNWIDDRRSPLTEPGIRAEEDDYVLAINGQPLRADDNPYRLLVNTAGDVVSLTLSETPDGKNSRTVEVKTLSSEGGLRYYDWVVRKERYTDSVSEGRIGYVHIPNMGGAGLKQFTSTYYAQLRKPGMIIDVRWNGGGFVSQLIIERLRRVLGGMGMSRNFEPYTYPAAVYHGHLACLLNEHSASDGDIFPYHFRKYGLGPLIGKRTWGGVVGIRGHRPLLDGGYVFTPEFAKYDLDRHWVMENYGVAPDIEVEYPPEIVQQGGDPQIDRAVEELLNKIRTSPRTIPDPPATPPDER
ncbi:MAG: PDZ domain-containing protein [Acidobacteria bacterium]|nr:PDZ domain-containing protein [Acidobacteriota bacterium]